MKKTLYGFSEIDKSNQNEITVCKVGKWSHPMYGDFEITPLTLNDFKRNFDAKVRKVEIGIDKDHNSYNGYVGWYKELKVIGDELRAVIEWTKEGVQLLTDSVYKYFSPEIAFDYEDMETHETFKNVLIGGGITNRPYFKGLKPLLASESNATDDPFQLFLNDKTMTPEEQAKADAEAKAKVEADAKAKADADAKAKEDADAEAKAKADADAKANEVKATEQKTEVAKLSEENATLKKQLRANDLATKVDAIVCSEGKTDKAFLPTAKDKITKFFEALTDEQITAFNEIAGMIVPKEMFKEHGKNVTESKEDSPKTLNEEMTAEAKKLSASENISFEVALKKLNKDKKYKSVV